MREANSSRFKDIPQSLAGVFGGIEDPKRATQFEVNPEARSFTQLKANKERDHNTREVASLLNMKPQINMDLLESGIADGYKNGQGSPVSPRNLSPAFRSRDQTPQHQHAINHKGQYDIIRNMGKQGNTITLSHAYDMQRGMSPPNSGLGSRQLYSGQRTP